MRVIQGADGGLACSKLSTNIRLGSVLFRGGSDTHSDVICKTVRMTPSPTPDQLIVHIPLYFPQIYFTSSDLNRCAEAVD